MVKESMTTEYTIDDIQIVPKSPIAQMMANQGWDCRAEKCAYGDKIMLRFKKKLYEYAEEECDNFNLEIAFPFDFDFPDNRTDELSYSQSETDLEIIFQNMKTDHMFSVGYLIESLKGKEVSYGHIKPNGTEVSISIKFVSEEYFKEMSVEEAIERLKFDSRYIEDKLHDIIYDNISNFVMNGGN